ncbi:MAG TPA: hypothetical protein GXZ65_02900 [Clostridiales bacterium]|nr:hypothetical protein [Clostridiales bacterium]
MKPFVFSLERVRDYKEQLLDREKIRLAALRRRREEILKRLTELNTYIEEKNQELQRLQDEGAYVSEINSLCFIIENAKEQREAALAALNKATEAVEMQRQKVIGQSQELNGFDRLKEKKLEEHKYLEMQESREIILEHLTTQIAFGGQ